MPQILVPNKKVFLILGLLFLSFFAFTTNALAARYWVGTDGADYNSTANWAAADPASCTGGGASVPTSADVVYLDADCDNSMGVGSAWSVAGLNVATGYAGTVTISPSYTLTVGASNLVVSAGTIIGNVYVSGNFTYTAGDISAVNLYFGGGGNAYFDHTLNSTATVTSLTINKDNGVDFSVSVTDTLIVTGNVTFTNGTFNALRQGVLQVGGNMTVSSNFDNNTVNGYVRFAGTGDQTFTNSTSYWGANVISAKPSGTLILAGTGSLAGYFSSLSGITTGNLILNGSAGYLSYTAGDISAINLTFVAAGNVYFEHTGNSSTTIASLTVNKTTGTDFSVSSGDILIVTGNVTFTDGTFNANRTGILEAKANLTVSANFDNNTLNGAVRFSGMVDQTFTNSTSYWTANVINAKTSGTLILSGAGSLAGYFNSLSGTTTGNLILNGSTGYLSYTAGDISAINLTYIGAGNVYFDHVGNSSTTIANLTINKSTGTDFSVSSSDTLIVTGNVTFTDGTFNAARTGVLEVQGNLSVGSLFDFNTILGLLRFAGVNNQTFSASTTLSANLGVAKTGGTLAISGTPVITGYLSLTSGTTTGNINLSGGYITYAGGDVSGLNLTSSGANSYVDVTVGSTMTVASLTIYKNTSAGFRIGSGDTLIVTGNTTFTDGVFGDNGGYTGTLEVRGNLSVGAAFDSGTAYSVIRFSGSNEQTFSALNTLSSYLEVAKTGGTLAISGTPWITGSLTFTSGTTTGNINVSTGSIYYAGGNTSAMNITVSGANSILNVTVGTTMTIANFTIYKNTSSGFRISASDILVVTGNTTFTDGAFNDNSAYTGTLEVQGNLSVAAAFDTMTAYGTLRFGGTGNQVFSSAISWAVNLSITKTAGSITLNSGVAVTSPAITIPSAVTLDLAGYNFTISGGYTVASGGTLKLQGGNTTVTTPTLSPGSTVEYNGTAGPYTIKNWSYKSITVSGGTDSIFVATSTALTALSTTTINSGILSLNGSNFTTTSFSNNGTLRLRGSEEITFINDTDSGIIEYVGDGDGFVDTYHIDPVISFFGLKINSADADDIYLTNIPVVNRMFSYWKMDDTTGTSTDSFGNTYNATWFGGPSATTSVPNQIKFYNPQALSLNGSTQYVDNTTFPAYTGPFSISVWIKPYAKSGATGDCVQTIFSNRGTSYLFALDANGYPEYYSGAWRKATTTVPYGVWSHLVYQYNGTNSYIYMNGNLIYTLAGGPSAWGAAGIRIGQRGDGTSGGYAFKGAIDDLRFYTKSLSQSEINSLYTGTDSTIFLSGDLIISSSSPNTFIDDLIMSGTDQAIAVNSTTTIASLSKVIGAGSTTPQTLTFGTTSPLVITGTTTLAGLGSGDSSLKLRSIATGTPWYFDPQVGRDFQYLDVQDSTNINALEIDTGNMTGFTDSGRNVGWGADAPVVTISRFGSQIATTTLPVTNFSLGGAYTLKKDSGEGTITSLTLHQRGSLSADTYISNLKLWTKTADTCAATKPVDAVQFGTGSATFTDNIATTTGSLTVTASTTCLYVTYSVNNQNSYPDLSFLGRTIDLEFTNPTTDIVMAGNTITPTNRVNIPGLTMIISDGSNYTEPTTSNPACSDNLIRSLLSIHTVEEDENPTLYYLQNCQVWKKVGNRSAYYLTNPNLQVHDLTFRKQAGGLVGLSITISNMDPGDEDVFMNVTKTLRTASTVRVWRGE